MCWRRSFTAWAMKLYSHLPVRPVARSAVDFGYREIPRTVFEPSDQIPSPPTHGERFALADRYAVPSAGSPRLFARLALISLPLPRDMVCLRS